jgi:hypothetical protein
MTKVLRRRTTTDADIEKLILTGLITSSEVIQRVRLIFDYNLFSLEVSRIISRWCINYYDQYAEAPLSAIQTIFQSEKANLKDGDRENVAEFLNTLSADFAANPPNSVFVADRAEEFFQQRKVLNLAKEVQGIIETGGSTAKAISLVISYKDQPSSSSILVGKKFTDTEFIQNIFSVQEDVLLDFPGDLGRFIGPLRRGYLFGIMGPMKRGKTNWLIRLAAQSIFRFRRVLFITLEMTEEQLGLRFLQHLGSYGEPSNEPQYDYIIPALDCRYNQDNTCRLAVRSCSVERPTEPFRPGQSYLPCSACRYERATQFTPRIYNVLETRPTITRRLALNLVEDMSSVFGEDMLQILSYPAYSANLKDIEQSIQALNVQGFVPDVIVIDYPDILAPEDYRQEGLARIDETWKCLKAMAQTKQVLVLAPTQGSRMTFKKPLMDPSDTPWDIRKLAHVDLMVGLNQTYMEKKDQVTRLNIIVHRWREYMPNKVYVALQQLRLVQPELDGFITDYNIGK